MTDAARQPVVGVTGLPCSGKSHVSNLLASGEVTGSPGVAIKADDIGHAVLRRPEVAEELSRRFGPGVVGEDGLPDRRKVAEAVFDHPAELAWLEGLLHPLIRAEALAMLKRIDGGRLVALEAALLLAGGMDRLCDVVLVVEAERRLRLARAAERGWDENEMNRREQRQLPLFTDKNLAACEARVVKIQNNMDGGLVEDLRAALSAVTVRKG